MSESHLGGQGGEQCVTVPSLIPPNQLQARIGLSSSYLFMCPSYSAGLSKHMQAFLEITFHSILYVLA